MGHNPNSIGTARRRMGLLAVLPAVGLTMLVCGRRIEGADPEGEPVRLRGVGCTVVRVQLDGAWRIAADAWCLTRSDRPGPHGASRGRYE